MKPLTITDEARFESDAQVGFIQGVHCIGCWSPDVPCPANVTFATNQLPNTSDKYKLCVRCNQAAWDVFNGRQAQSNAVPLDYAQ